MIFVTVGSQKFPFNRLLKTLDELIEKGVLKEEVFAQTGYSDYVPRNFEYKKFIDREEFVDLIDRADLVITHGGSGAIIGSVKRGKKTIAVPRKAKYGEHVDDHQMQIIEQFSAQNLICGCEDCDCLEEALKTVRKTDYKSYQSSTWNIVNSIAEFIEKN